MWTFTWHMVIAAVLGGVIGLEREVTKKPAGLRTHILICMSAALLTYLSGRMAREGTLADPTRIAAQIVTGIGFLGAGAIIQARGSVQGLTTAAGIWSVAAVGMAIGAGFIQEALIVTLIILLVLHLFGRIEKCFKFQQDPEE